MWSRPKGKERAVLVQIALPEYDALSALGEFKELAKSAGAAVLAVIQGTRSTPDAKYYVGLGKAEEIQEQVKAHHAELVLINHDLSPSQERNLEQLLQCRVVTRSGLILDIFASRARTAEGKLQVELAQLEYMSTRLVRGWTHLERQKGGIGLRGPGETQLETDRRLLRARIKTIQKRLEKVRKNREQNRQSRQKSGFPIVSLIGYTNAGKSTLFNQLTEGIAYVADKLFATLDPQMRKLNLPFAQPVILADTVGFIRDLPHALIEAFRATLEETQQASLLLHVIDANAPNWQETIHEVKKVLAELEVEDIPVIQVFNKIDQLSGWVPKVSKKGKTHKVWISAENGAGLNLLLETIAVVLQGMTKEEEIRLSATDAKLRAKLYQLHAVIHETPMEDGGWKLHIKLTEEERKNLLEKTRT